MKKFIFVGFSLTLLNIAFAAAQDFWDYIPTVPKNASCFLVDSSGNLFCGTEHGIFKSLDDGLTWSQVNSSGTVSFSINKKGHIFAGTHSTQLVKSIDDGKTWTKITVLADDPKKVLPDQRPILFLNNGDLLVCPVYNGIYRTTDEGLTWHSNKGGLDTNITRNVRAFAVAPNGNIFAGTENSIFKSEDNGYTWVKLDFDTLCPVIWSVLILKNGDILAGSQKYYCGVFRSRDGGKTWEKACEGLNLDLYWQVISMIQNKDNGEIFLTGAWDGVYVSKDGGNTVQKITSDIDTANSNWWNVFITPKGYLLVATSEQGIYRSKVMINDVSRISDLTNFNLVCYPNPTEGALTLKYETAKAGNIKLEIFDLTGKRIRVLVDGFSDAGEHEVVFDASGLEQGIYFYKLVTGTDVITRKVAIVR